MLLWSLTIPLAGLARDQTYIVKPKDTLTSISREHGVSVTALASYNNINRAATIYIGQHLKIPDSAKSAPTPQLSSSVARSIAKAPVKPGRWRYIVIHHSGSDQGTLKSIDRYHREERHMENGLAYHFLIGNGHGLGDGVIAVGDRWKKQLDGGHLHSLAQNKIALGICLIGNFDEDRPTKKQLDSLENLIRALMKRCHLTVSAVKTHQQINVVYTRCPGSKFPTRSFLARLK